MSGISLCVVGDVTAVYVREPPAFVASQPSLFLTLFSVTQSFHNQFLRSDTSLLFFFKFVCIFVHKWFRFSFIASSVFLQHVSSFLCIFLLYNFMQFVMKLVMLKMRILSY